MKKFTFLLVVSVFSACVFGSNGFMYPTVDTLHKREVNLSGGLSYNISMGFGENFEVGGALSSYETGLYAKWKIFPDLSIVGSYLPLLNMSTFYGVYAIRFGDYDLNLGTGGINIPSFGFLGTGGILLEFFSVGRKKIPNGYAIAEIGLLDLLSNGNFGFTFGVGMEEFFGPMKIKGGLLLLSMMNGVSYSFFQFLPYFEIGLDLKFGG